MVRGVDGRMCEEFSAGYYGLCTIGGMLSAGTTHLAITPLDVLKVNMQVCFSFNPFVSGLSLKGCWFLFCGFLCKCFVFWVLVMMGFVDL